MKKLIPVFMGILLLVVLAACGKEGIDKALSDKSLTMIQKVKTDLKDYQLAYVKDDDDKTGVLEYYKDSNKQDISNIQLDSALKKQDSEVKINLMNGLDGLIAMVEISGTKLAKEATELVLLDSNKEVDEAIGVSLTNRSEVKDGKTVAIVAIPSVDAKTASSLKRIELRNGSNEIIYQNNLDSSKIKAQALSERAKKNAFFPNVNKYIADKGWKVISSATQKKQIYTAILRDKDGSYHLAEFTYPNSKLVVKETSKNNNPQSDDDLSLLQLQGNKNQYIGVVAELETILGKGTTVVLKATDDKEYTQPLHTGYNDKNALIQLTKKTEMTIDTISAVTIKDNNGDELYTMELK
ncbi:hypothetical protein [Paenilisteria rocourtiae]|uniref:Lipoprotein n=1 Tax=Listeria rocourtiae TaxID=647910 RepID=A0A4V3DPE8_9LIST|nr:hypothetical protein [Listeria rocourtiae]MBC1435524.1 hypothetical protein [Listeria rocourtiae]MBC1604861.1 hypothetical protein [Listeria rocourtiae]TDR51996.1 hypothetical protein DFP96_11073 [Listeria rocourtiae]